MSQRSSMKDGPLAQLFATTAQRQEEAAPAAPPKSTKTDSANKGARAKPTKARAPKPRKKIEEAVPVNETSRIATSSSVSGLAESSTYLAVIRVVGVGGAGTNALERMMDAGVTGVEFIAINTDLQQLEMSNAPVRLHIGADLTRGLGAGADPEVGEQAAKASYDHIKHVLKGSDMVFVTCGEGGGTGTGAGPVVCRAARELGALTVAITTTPFSFEGSQRSRAAMNGLEELRDAADTVIVIPNNRLLEVLHRGTSMVEAFRVADDVLRQGVQGISDLITMPGLINVDFADVRTIMKEAGSALMGIGFGAGENRAVEAAEAAINSPLIEQSAKGASGILLSISGGDDLSLHEVTEAANVVQQSAAEDANIIFGATVDPRLNGQMWVTVVATGFPSKRTPIVQKREGRILGTRGRREESSSDSLELPAFLR